VEQLLHAFVQEAQHLFGNDLVAVILYGSAATEEHVRGRSDINTVVALHRVTSDLLRRASSQIRSWHRQGFATPLFLDAEFVRTSLDVFPIEFLDMRERHRVLWGPDLLADLTIERVHLRRQCEQELRGKLLKLRQTYVESAQIPKHLESILVSAVASVIVLSRTLLHLAGEKPEGSSADVLEHIRRRFDLSTTNLQKAVQLKRGDVRVTGSSLDLLYQGVLEEFQRLVKVVDGLPT